METTKIKRFEPEHDGFGYIEMNESPQGEWVRWEDVKDILEIASDAVRQCIVQTGRPPDRQPRARIDD